MDNFSQISFDSYTVISKETKLEGSFNFSGETHIYGKLKGSINIDQESSLYIEESADIQAKIKCHHLDVYGHIFGDIESDGKVTVYPSAKVTGQIISKLLQVHPGAQIEIKADIE